MLYRLRWCSERSARSIRFGFIYFPHLPSSILLTYIFSVGIPRRNGAFASCSNSEMVGRFRFLYYFLPPRDSVTSYWPIKKTSPIASQFQGRLKSEEYPNLLYEVKTKLQEKNKQETTFRSFRVSNLVDSISHYVLFLQSVFFHKYQSSESIRRASYI